MIEKIYDFREVSYEASLREIADTIANETKGFISQESEVDTPEKIYTYFDTKLKEDSFVTLEFERCDCTVNYNVDKYGKTGLCFSSSFDIPPKKFDNGMFSIMVVPEEKVCIDTTRAAEWIEKYITLQEIAVSFALTQDKADDEKDLGVGAVDLHNAMSANGYSCLGEREWFKDMITRGGKAKVFVSYSKDFSEFTRAQYNAILGVVVLLSGL